MEEKYVDGRTHELEKRLELTLGPSLHCILEKKEITELRKFFLENPNFQQCGPFTRETNYVHHAVVTSFTYSLHCTLDITPIYNTRKHKCVQRSRSEGPI